MVILCDFDDTAADRNVATLLFNAFPKQPLTATAPRWRELHKQYLNAEISLAEYQENAFAGLTATRSEQASYVQQNANLRPGFRELAGYCALKGIELAIVSHGLDYYVQALLEKEDLGHIPAFAVETGVSATGEETYTYRYAQDECPWTPGNCKCYLLDEYKERGHQVIYVGDGLSDTCPARRADFVFARDGLLSFCQAQGIPHQELTDFTVLLAYLEEQDRENS
jgi:2-hydroxy-3-keto-5-methylthiopentenyl-1-phosphate phosphatase